MVSRPSSRCTAGPGRGAPWRRERKIHHRDTETQRKHREGRRKKEEGRRKKEEGRRKKEEGRRKKEEGRRKKEEGRRKKEEGRRKKEEGRRKKEEGRRKKEEDSRREETSTRSRRLLNPLPSFSVELCVSGAPGQVWLFYLTERCQTCELLVRHVVAVPRTSGNWTREADRCGLLGDRAMGLDCPGQRTCEP